MCQGRGSAVTPLWLQGVLLDLDEAKGLPWFPHGLRGHSDVGFKKPPEGVTGAQVKGRMGDCSFAQLTGNSWSRGQSAMQRKWSGWVYFRLWVPAPHAPALSSQAAEKQRSKVMSRGHSAKRRKKTKEKEKKIPPGQPDLRSDSSTVLCGCGVNHPHWKERADPPGPNPLQDPGLPFTHCNIPRAGLP